MKKILFFLAVTSHLLFAQYHSYDELTSSLKKLASRYSHVTLSSIAKTSEGRDVWAVTIGTGEPKKALLVVGGIEAPALVGSEHALRLIQFIAESYGTADSITSLIDKTTLYILPRVNPDAAEWYFSKPKTARLTNSTPFDDDRDGAVDEDDVEDLNNDGIISWMRIKDPRGEWVVHPDDPRLMKKADGSRGEHGIYRLLTEGIDNDKDDEWNEDPKGGTDLNRNFTYNFQFFGANSGIHQISEPESKALADFLFDRPNIGTVFTFSSNDNLTTAWKNEPSRSESPVITTVMKHDEDYFAYISKRFSEISTLTRAPKPEKGEGSFSEWAYYHAGRWSFAVRPWWPGDISRSKDSLTQKDSLEKSSDPKKSSKESSNDTELHLMKWYDAIGVKDAAVPWKKFNHPDFPGREVEIGGLSPFVSVNPPPESVNALAKKYSDFILFLAAQSADVAIENTKVEKLSSNLFRVSVDVVNHGYFPTNSAMGVKTRWMRNVRIVMDPGAGNSVKAGKEKQMIDPIPGNGGYKTVYWIVNGKGSVTVTAESPVSGKKQLKIDLKN